MEEKYFTPVLITVCNRNTHLERCLDALVCCTDFGRTDVFIAIDFPPEEKYMAGYCKVVELLKRKYNKYVNIHPIYRNYNYGALENSMQLKNYILDILGYDKYISIEDDSEVAKNFLVYCNECLKRYSKRKDICGICGSSQVWYGNGFIENKNEEKDKLRKMPLAWHGFATWKEEYYNVKNFCKEFEYVFRIKNLIKIHRTSRCLFYSLLDRFFSTTRQLPWKGSIVYPIDFVWDIYMILSNKCAIFPTINKVRDWGMDGSGIHFIERSNNAICIEKMNLDNENIFIMPNEEPILDTTELLRHDSFGCPSFEGKLKKMIQLLVYKLCWIKLS